MDGGAWWAAVHGVAKSQTRLSDFTFTSHFHSLEKEMETHSSVLAWRIPGTGSLVGCCLWGRTESDTTEATQQQQQQECVSPLPISFRDLMIPPCDPFILNCYQFPSPTAILYFYIFTFLIISSEAAFRDSETWQPKRKDFYFKGQGHRGLLPVHP